MPWIKKKKLLVGKLLNVENTLQTYEKKKKKKKAKMIKILSLNGIVVFNYIFLFQENQ